jgi:NAD(P)H-dependent FMN reductase
MTSTNATHPHPTLRLAIITGSTRPGRFGPTVAAWFAGQASAHPSFDVDRIDLADVDLPLDLPRSHTPAIEHYLDRLGRADAFVVVTPEYNHGYPASLKQAIDVAKDEWRRKPIGLVSYGARSGGIRAAEQLRQIFPELEAMTIREAIALPNMWDLFGDDGKPLSPEPLAAAARALLDQLAWWASALQQARDGNLLVAMSS